MKKVIFIFAIIVVSFYSCTTTKSVLKTEAYQAMYQEKPLSFLIMPPINRSTSVEAKEFFHATLSIPIAEAGYYVIPTFLSMEILKRESAYDAELLLNGPLQKFGDVFGADVAVFTIIHKWDKTYGAVIVDVEYILKSVKTNEVLYTRRGEVNYDTSIQFRSSGGIYGALIAGAASLIATTANTAATKYVDVARITNAYTFEDLPSGQYSPVNPKDSLEYAGSKVFKVRLNSKYAGQYK